MFKHLLINEQITADNVRLIGNNGEQFGVVTLSAAKQLANEQELDLVLVSNASNPPVCKLMDYGKYRYEQIKKEKELKKNQKTSILKEIQLSLTISEYDMNYRVKQALKFLQSGDKVKIVLKMRGRQQAFAKNAVEIVNKFALLLEEGGIVDKPCEINGRNVIMIVAPKKSTVN